MNDYKVIKARFVEWLKLPPAARNPATITEFADQHGVSRETLHRWKNDPEVKRAVADHGLSVLSVDDISAIIVAMKLKAKSGNVQAAKLLLQLAGIDGKNLSPKDKQPEIDPEEFRSKSIEELEAIASGEA